MVLQNYAELVSIPEQMNQMFRGDLDTNILKAINQPLQVGLTHLSENNTPLLYYCLDSAKPNSLHGKKINKWLRVVKRQKLISGAFPLGPLSGCLWQQRLLRLSQNWCRVAKPTDSSAKEQVISVNIVITLSHLLSKLDLKNNIFTQRFTKGLF